MCVNILRHGYIYMHLGFMYTYTFVHLQINIQGCRLEHKLSIHEQNGRHNLEYFLLAIRRIKKNMLHVPMCERSI